MHGRAKKSTYAFRPGTAVSGSQCAARRDPAEQHQGEERERDREDRLHARSIASRAGRRCPRGACGSAPSLKLAVFSRRPFHVSVFSRPGAAVLSRRLARRRHQPARRPQPAVPDRRDRGDRRARQERAGAARRQDRAGAAHRRHDRRAEERQPALDRARAGARRSDPEGAAARHPERARRRRRATRRSRASSSSSTRCGRPGFSTLREIAAAIDRFKASGKKVVAWGSHYDQRQYYIAAHADEVYLHPLGMVYIAGFGSLRNYYKDALDKLGVTVNVVRVGTFKSAVEPFIANEPSAPALEADKVLYGGLWKTYVDAVEKERKLARGIDHARHRRGAAAARRGRRRRRQVRARRKARRRAEDARRAARAHDRARREGRRRQHLSPDLVRRLPRPRQAEADRRRDRRRRRRGRDRRRQRAGGNDRRPLDREPDQEGARRQGRQGARRCASIRPAAASSAPSSCGASSR